LLKRLGGSALESELLGEKASALGHHGRQVEQALLALRQFDAHPGAKADRLVLVQAAAREVWKFFVQRELCGFRDQRDAIRLYGIPSEVLARLGEMDRPRGTA
jgi:hypothetical protein